MTTLSPRLSTARGEQWHTFSQLTRLVEGHFVGGGAAGQGSVRGKADLVVQRMHRAVAVDGIETCRVGAAETVAAPAALALHAVMRRDALGPAHTIPHLAVIDARIVPLIAAIEIIEAAHGLFGDQVRLGEAVLDVLVADVLELSGVHPRSPRGDCLPNARPFDVEFVGTSRGA